MTEKKSSFGELIREKRTILGLSQEELAERVGVSRQAVAKWESGKSFPATERLLEICKVLEIPAEEMLGEAVHNAQEEKQKMRLPKMLVMILVVGLIAIWVIYLIAVAVHGFSGDSTVLYDNAKSMIFVYGFQMVSLGLVWVRIWFCILVFCVIWRVLKKL